MTKSRNSVESNTVTEVQNIKHEGKPTRFVYNSSANSSQKISQKIHILNQTNLFKSKLGRFGQA